MRRPEIPGTMGDWTEQQRLREQPRERDIVMLSSVCGKHHDDNCPSCASAKQSNDDRLTRLRERPVEVSELVDKHIQRCRDAVAECPKWSPAQAEWSRARDALLNFRDDYLAMQAQATKETGE